VSEKKFKKCRFQLLKFILYHMFIPTSAVVFITIAPENLSFFGGYCFELCTCARFLETVFAVLVLVSVLVLKLWSWLQDWKKLTLRFPGSVKICHLSTGLIYGAPKQVY